MVKVVPKRLNLGDAFFRMPFPVLSSPNVQTPLSLHVQARPLLREAFPESPGRHRPAFLSPSTATLHGYVNGAHPEQPSVVT